jgi:hypothetical protein
MARGLGGNHIDDRGKTRIETDSFGPIEVPAEHYWGAQTQRSLAHFAIGSQIMPVAIVHALAMRWSSGPPRRSIANSGLCQPVYAPQSPPPPVKSRPAVSMPNFPLPLFPNRYAYRRRRPNQTRAGTSLARAQSRARREIRGFSPRSSKPDARIFRTQPRWSGVFEIRT